MATDSPAVLTARKVSQVLATRDISRLSVSEAASIPYATLGRKLRGVSAFDVNEIGRLADALGVPAADLLPDQMTVRTVA